MTVIKIPEKRSHSWLLLLLLLASLAITVLFFEQMPIDDTTLAMDWHGLWAGIKDGVIEYGNTTGLRIPPWSVLTILPLGWLSFRASWGVLAYVTIVVLSLSVPHTQSRPVMLFGVLALVLAFPALRTIADGNFEALVILGCLLIGYGVSKQNVFALVAGILLATSKIQESWLLILLLPIVLLKQLRKDQLFATLVGLAVVGIPCLLWKGADWLHAVFAITERGSMMDSSLWATSARSQIPAVVTAALGLGIALITIGVIWQSRERFSREQIGLLVAASLILSQYTAGNNFLTLYAIVVGPLLLSSVPLGLVVIALANLPFAFLGNRDMLYEWSATYWTLVCGIVWTILILRILFGSKTSANQLSTREELVARSACSQDKKVIA
jgi:hypothetical protein